VTSDEEVLAFIMQERGYLVTRSFKKFAIGERLAGLGKAYGAIVDTQQPFYVTALTDESDYLAQLALMASIPGVRVIAPGDGGNFYRVTTD
jgi:hypothetical protein